MRLDLSEIPNERITELSAKVNSDYTYKDIIDILETISLAPEFNWADQKFIASLISDTESEKGLTIQQCQGAINIWEAVDYDRN